MTSTLPRSASRSAAPERRLAPSGALLAMAFGAYLLLSVIIWWGAWSTHPTTVTTCGCDDPALSTWFLAWPAYALAHGHNPFFSTAIFHPSGINLVSNTGMLAIGIPLAPITWIFGPVATLNVASTLGPVLSATAMFWLLRRWTIWAPAAFAAGLVFGFSPIVFDNIAVGHLNLVVVAALPLLIATLDEILIRQRRSPLRGGILLGLVIVVQFFISTELLAMSVIVGIVGIALLVAFGLIRHRDQVVARVDHAAKALLVTLVFTGALLAYPLWFALAGPAHLSGLVWPGIVPGTGGITPSGIFHLVFLSQSQVALFAGYQGHALPGLAYLGGGLVAVDIVGTALWWRDLRLWFFGALGALSVLLSMGIQSSWTPWRVLAHVPLVKNIVTSRFSDLTLVFAAVMFAIVVDHTRHAVARWITGRRRSPSVSGQTPVTRATRRDRRGALVASVVAIGVAVIGVVPLASAVAGDIPLSTRSVAVPPWFVRVEPHLATSQVVLTFPPPVNGGAALTWQALGRLHVALATGAGPGSIPERAGEERDGLDVLTNASSVFASFAAPTPVNVAAVRSALKGWGVTNVVISNPASLSPRQIQPSAAAWAIGFFTLAIGRPPTFADDAWVWSDVTDRDPQRTISSAALDACTPGTATDPAALSKIGDCVMAASHRS